MKLDWVPGLFPENAGALTVAGFLGGVVRWVTTKSSWTEGVGGIIVGGISAGYIGPLVIAMIAPQLAGDLSESTGPYLAGYLIGVGGLTLSASVIGLVNIAGLRARKPAEEQPNDDA